MVSGLLNRERKGEYVVDNVDCEAPGSKSFGDDAKGSGNVNARVEAHSGI